MEHSLKLIKEGRGDHSIGHSVLLSISMSSHLERGASQYDLDMTQRTQHLLLVA